MLVCEILRKISSFYCQKTGFPREDWSRVTKLSRFLARKYRNSSIFYSKYFYKHNLTRLHDKSPETKNLETCADLCAVQNYGITLRGLSNNIKMPPKTVAYTAIPNLKTWKYRDTVKKGRRKFVTIPDLFKVRLLVISRTKEQNPVYRGESQYRNASSK